MCWEIPAVLRRLAQRFPALEITAVTQTYGSFVYTAYPKDPAKEAEVSRHWLHDVHRMPGALVVTSTSYTYLPEPDGRVMRYLKVPNTANYFSAVGESWSYIRRVIAYDQYTSVVPNGAAFLVDRDGTIVTASQISRTGESDLAKVIDVLLQQSGATGRSPSRP